MSNKQISAAFVKAQKGFAPALKTTKNEFFKSKYADLSACVDAVIDSLNDNGIALIQHCHECESGVTVETIFLHESGESMSCGKLHVPASKQDPQGYGSALTYARRYSLMASCGLAPEDDDGNAASQPVKQAAKPAQNKIQQDFSGDIKAIQSCLNMQELSQVWAGLSPAAKHDLEAVKDKQKATIAAQSKTEKETE
jgi:hypothetical protein